MTLLLAAVVDLTIILAAGLAATLLMRRRSAALRHWMLAAAIVAGALAPALELILPEWPLPLPTLFGPPPAPLVSTPQFTSQAAPVITEAMATPSPARWPWTEVAVATWMMGAFIGLFGLATGLLRLARFSARCTPILAGPWRETADQLASDLHLPRVELLQSADPALLVTWGLFTPKIILPAGAAAWTEPRRRVVLAHEMAHIRRRDWLLHMSAEALRVLHWVNPLAWLACRRLRQESEYACDDAVLSGGVAPTEYATHLLAVARQAIGHRRAWASAPAIAHPSTLERRIAAMLIEKRNREPLTRRACVAAIAGIVAVALPITAFAVSRAADRVSAAPDLVLAPPIVTEDSGPRAVSAPPRPAPAAARNQPAAAVQQAPASISIAMQDPSGGVLPGVRATLTDTQSGAQYTARSDGAGRLTFRELQPGRYDLSLSLPGFAIVNNVMAVTAGADVRRTIVLPLGSLEETITVVCGSPAARLRDAAIFDLVKRARELAMPTLSAAAQDRRPAGTPVRVGGQIKVPSQITKVNPVCPQGILPSADTIVVLAARIGVDGYLNDLRHVPAAAGGAAPAQEFVDSALEAVRQWAYIPTRLNNVAVEANVTITIRYSR